MFTEPLQGIVLNSQQIRDGPTEDPPSPPYRPVKAG